MEGTFFGHGFLEAKKNIDYFGLEFTEIGRKTADKISEIEKNINFKSEILILTNLILIVYLKLKVILLFLLCTE